MSRRVLKMSQIFNKQHLVCTVLMMVFNILFRSPVYSQTLEWSIPLTQSPFFKDARATAVSVVDAESFYVLISSDSSREYLYQAYPRTKSFELRWTSDSGSKVNRNQPPLLIPISSGHVLVSRSGMGFFDRNHRYEPRFSDCLDSMYSVVEVQPLRSGGIEVVTGRAQRPVVNAIYARPSFERWQDSTCLQLGMWYYGSSYGAFQTVAMSPSGQIVVAYSNRKSETNVLLRSEDGAPLVTNLYSDSDIRNIVKIWSDPWGWTFLVEKKYSTIDNELVRVNHGFELIDRVRLNMQFEIIHDVRRTDSTIVVSSNKKVVVIQLSTLSLQELSGEKVQNDLNLKYMESFFVSDLGHGRLVSNTYSGIVVYSFPTSVKESPVSSGSSRSIFVEYPSQLNFESVFAQACGTYSVFDALGRRIVGETNDPSLLSRLLGNYSGLVHVRTSCGEALNVLFVR